jgi:hypothetical protein
MQQRLFGTVLLHVQIYHFWYRESSDDCFHFPSHFSTSRPRLDVARQYEHIRPLYRLASLPSRPPITRTTLLFYSLTVPSAAQHLHVPLTSNVTKNLTLILCSSDLSPSFLTTESKTVPMKQLTQLKQTQSHPIQNC